MEEPASRLRLVALDPDDLAVVSAHMQDATVKASEIAWLARDRRVALVCNRFDWEGAQAGQPRRRRTGLRFDRVMHVTARGISRGGEEVLNLLAIRFTPAVDPGGMIELTFAGGAALRLAVECVECALDDLGPMWETASTPRHVLS